MKKIYAYIISLTAIFLTLPLAAQEPEQPADSVDIPLKIRTGIDIAGPAIYLADRDILNIEAFTSVDFNEIQSLYIGAGFSDYRHSRYNYNFAARGPFMKAGVDFNLLRPELAKGSYWAGLGFRYGMSRFSYETSFFSHENYWGQVTSSLPRETSWCHFLEAAGGFKAEVADNVSIGWIISIRKLLYSGAPKDLRPVYLPGYGEGGTSFSYAINYFISWNIPFKKIRVQIKPEPVEEPDEDAPEEGDDFSRNVGRQRIGT